ncbi:MAG: hypothetical protein ACJ761_04900 [Chloroflexota bacterium]
MHMQVRAFKDPGFSMQDDGEAVEPTTRAEPGALIELLQLLRDNDFNLKTAGGSRIETGGEFVFALDDDEDEGAPERAAALINERSEWHARIVEPFHCHTKDQPGGLLECLEKIRAEGLAVDEIFVGTPEGNGEIPVQITTTGF